jgi:hypothetical protein
LNNDFETKREVKAAAAEPKETDKKLNLDDFM